METKSRTDAALTLDERHAVPRIAYLSGPVDAVEVIDVVSAGSALGYLGTSYLEHWWKVGRKLDFDGLVITTLDGDASITDRDRCRIENRPMPRSGGLAYHLGMLRWSLRCVRSIVRFRPDVAVITAGGNYSFVMLLLRLRGIKVIAALHSVLWQPFARLRRVDRFLLALNRVYYRFGIDAALVASRRTESQLRELRRDEPLPLELFLPTYSEARFSTVPSVLEKRPPDPFGVFFAGRIEHNKGVYDLVEVARSLQDVRPGQFRFHMCGEGSETSALRAEIDRLGLADVVIVHGFRTAPEMAEIIRECHATLVPTRSSFEEGFNMVCSESVLFGRPVVTSAVCPALDFIRSSSLEVEPDDIDGYRDALLRLVDDRTTYEALAHGCDIDRQQFLATENSYGAKYERTLRGLLDR